MDADLKAMRMVTKGFELASLPTRRLLVRHALEQHPDIAQEIIQDYERRRRQLSRTKEPICPGQDAVVVPDKTSVAVPDNTPKRTKQSNNSQGLDYTPGFRSFWSLYPKRIGKGAAFLSWKRSGCESISEVVVKAVREQLPYLNREGGQYRPLPATWLNQKRWQDEPFNTKSEGTSPPTSSPVSVMDLPPLSEEEVAQNLVRMRELTQSMGKV